jgi:cytidyltransferase-like protein
MYTHILIFGTFDGFHDGHRAYIEEASKLASQVTAVVTPDKVIQELKQYIPRHDLATRIEFIEKEYPSIKVIVGDTEINTWRILEDVAPDAILLGYDQDTLQESLQNARYIQTHHIPIIRAQAHKPHTHHNTLLHN